MIDIKTKGNKMYAKKLKLHLLLGIQYKKMIFLLIILAILTADMYTKRCVNEQFAVEEKKELIKNHIEIWHKKNTGFSFSLHSGHIKLVSFIASALTAAASIWLIKLIPRKGHNFLKLGLSFSIGGALGNLYERLFKKSVTDFIFIKFKNAPIFNVADIFIFFGNLIILATTNFKKRI